MTINTLSINQKKQTSIRLHSIEAQTWNIDTGIQREIRNWKKIRDEERSAGLLSDDYLPSEQLTLDNFISITRQLKYVSTAENTMDKPCVKLNSKEKENGKENVANNQKVTSEILRANEERMLDEFNTHWAHWKENSK